MPAEAGAGYKPRDLCRRWRVGLDKVMGFIRRGELPALNVSGKSGGRPRYVITPEALAEFERRRQVMTPPPKAKKRKRITGVIDFYPD